MSAYKLNEHVIIKNEENISSELIEQILHPDYVIGYHIALFGICSEDSVKQIYKYETEHDLNYTVHFHPFSISQEFSSPALYPNFNPS